MPYDIIKSFLCSSTLDFKWKKKKKKKKKKKIGLQIKLQNDYRKTKISTKK